MIHWEQTLVGAGSSLRQALETIDRAGSQMALVVDAGRRLLGTLTDGDVRRGLLKGLRLDDPVLGAMHTAPTCAREGDSRQSILATMRRLGLHHVPVLDGAGARQLGCHHGMGAGHAPGGTHT
jgi:CBS domain-containing protein